MRTALLAAVFAYAGCSTPGGPLPGEPPPSPARSAKEPPFVPGSATASASPALAAPSASASASTSEPPPEDPAARKARVVAELAGKTPRAWGQDIAGVLTRVPSTERVMALTFDACGGPGGDGYDAALVDHLRRERVPATLFVTSKWIAARKAEAAALAADALFEIQNHGSAHRPCSVTGRSAYDIRGTRDVASAADEIQRGALAIQALTGKAPRFYRPGTAYFDDVCLDVARLLGHAAAGFAVNGDGGAGFTRTQVRDALVRAADGSIVLLHMNHPSGGTAEGVMDALPILRARGVKFVRLGDVVPK